MLEHVAQGRNIVNENDSYTTCPWGGWLFRGVIYNRADCGAHFCTVRRRTGCMEKQRAGQDRVRLDQNALRAFLTTTLNTDTHRSHQLFQPLLQYSNPLRCSIPVPLTLRQGTLRRVTDRVNTSCTAAVHLCFAAYAPPVSWSARRALVAWRVSPLVPQCPIPPPLQARQSQQQGMLAAPRPQRGIWYLLVQHACLQWEAAPLAFEPVGGRVTA